MTPTQISRARHFSMLNLSEMVQDRDIVTVESLYDTIRYDSVYFTCSKKLTGSQLSPPHYYEVTQALLSGVISNDDLE